MDHTRRKATCPSADGVLARHAVGAETRVNRFRSGFIPFYSIESVVAGIYVCAPNIATLNYKGIYLGDGGRHKCTTVHAS